MQRDLVLRRLGEEEPGVEAPGREGWRDPVRERRHEVGGDLEILGFGQVDDRRLVLGELGAPARLDTLQLGGRNHRPLAALARQQDAALLEGLTHAGDAEFQFGGAALFSTAAARAQPRIAVGILELATGKDQRAGEGVDLVMAHHHEHLESRAGVAGLRRAQQKHGRRRTRRRHFFLGRIVHPLIVLH